MSGWLSAAARNAKHGDRVACVSADTVVTSQRNAGLSQSSSPFRTSQISCIVIALSLCLATGCAYSKNLYGKSRILDQNVSAQTIAAPQITQADCAVPVATSSGELTAFPVAPPTVATVNPAPIINGTMQQHATQQPQPIQPQQVTASPVQSQPAPGVAQQPTQPTQPLVPQQLPQLTQAIDAGTATQSQGPLAQPQLMQTQPMPVEPAPAPQPFQLPTSNSPGLPPVTIQPSFVNPKQASGPEMTAVPASAMRAQAQSGSAATAACPPGMVPSYGYTADVVSPPEKLAECEKQVHEMNQRLTELRYDSEKVKATMEQMVEQQRQLLIVNERLRQQAEMADQRYLDELDSLSQIVGEVVSKKSSGNKPTTANKTSRGANPLRTVPQSTAGQSL